MKEYEKEVANKKERKCNVRRWARTEQNTTECNSVEYIEFNQWNRMQ